ncbi:DUF2917 domain-containing protein [Massilia endophytica]|uniref:DUF2917 domain-containing protein n=1 Tax=Massilia endophytica TaxID=2899220 RepID=UPI001E5B2253|nr:DUF2917 domain-containing protein [Massilia endophytica]UGQ47946.1 DUF2917 domain-containing protein [Massilia endophytica]
MEYQLAPNRPLRLEHAGGQVVECLEGVAWITSYGQYTDFLLRPGQEFVVPNDGLTLVEAMGCGRIRVAEAEAQSQMEQLLRRTQLRLVQARDHTRHSLQPAPCSDCIY